MTTPDHDTAPQYRLMPLYWGAVVYTALGLLSGLYYRELTKHEGFTGATQLSVLHTHLLVLGTVFMLVFLVTERVFRLSASAQFMPMVAAWHAGVALTTGTMAVIGTMQVYGTPQAPPALAGIAGLGHITMTVGFVLFLVVLKARVQAVNGTD